MITNVNFRKVENGYFMQYCEKGTAKEAVFYTWQELCSFLKNECDLSADKVK